MDAFQSNNIFFLELVKNLSLQRDHWSVDKVVINMLEKPAW